MYVTFVSANGERALYICMYIHSYVKLVRLGIFEICIHVYTMRFQISS